MFVAGPAEGAAGLSGSGSVEKEMVLFVRSSVIPVIGLPVLAAAQESELGVVVSVKEVLLAVPGNGSPVPLMVP